MKHLITERTHAWIVFAVKIGFGLTAQVPEAVTVVGLPRIHYFYRLVRCLVHVYPELF